MLNWSEIDTVLLDMDGTLLDLRYDNHFWNEQLQFHYAKRHNLSVEQAQQRLVAHFREVSGTLNWYCLDYWETTLGLPIRQLKAQTTELIQLRPDTQDFLTQLQKAGKDIALITNAHPDALALKNEHTRLHSCVQNNSRRMNLATAKSSKSFGSASSKLFRLIRNAPYLSMTVSIFWTAHVNLVFATRLALPIQTAAYPRSNFANIQQFHHFSSYRCFPRQLRLSGLAR